MSFLTTSSAKIQTPNGASYHTHQVGVGITGDVQSIGPLNLPGIQNAFARADHVHQGVHGLNALFGDVTITGQQGITITLGDNNSIIIGVVLD